MANKKPENASKPSEAGATTDHQSESGLKKTQRVAGDAAQSATDALKSGASDLASQTRETAEKTAESVGDAVDRVSDSLRSAASSLQDGSVHERTFGQLAQGLADVSDAIRDQDIKELSTGVRDFARRNPLLFAGAAALLGYSLSRMISKDRDQT